MLLSGCALAVSHHISCRRDDLRQQLVFDSAQLDAHQQGKKTALTVAVSSAYRFCTTVKVLRLGRPHYLKLALIWLLLLT